jgi:tetratricopeptide (TPR) repeat protein
MKRLVGLLVAAGLAGAIFLAGALLPTRASQNPIPTLSLPAPSPLPSAASGLQKLQTTITSLQSRLQGNPGDAEALSSLGLAYLQEARLTVNPSYYTKADEVLRKSVAIDRKSNFQGSLGMGILAGARHRFGAALRWGRRAQAENPYNADVRGLEADALIELGRYRAARQELQEMVNLRPGLSSLSRISYYRELHGDLAGAIQAMAAAFRDAGGSGQDAAWASYQLGDLQLLAGHLVRAEFLYRRGIYLDPGYYLPKVGTAKVAAARGDLSTAARILKQVVTTYPAPIYVMLLGDIYRAEGLRSEARREYSLVQAEQRLFSANGVIPDTEMMIFFVDHHRRLHRTLREARREYAKRPSVRVADALGWVLYANGKFAQAQRYARRALRLGTIDPTYYFHAGMIAKAVGKRTLALRYLRRALRFNPHFSVRYAAEAVHALRALESS